jgi:hypothetical protein
MNLSHAHSHRAPQPKSYLGIGVVVVLHIAAIYAFSAGLIHAPIRTPENITLKPLPPEAKPEPPKPEPLPVDRPVMKEIQTIPVPTPDDIVIERDPVVSTVPLRPDAGPLVATGPTTTPTVAPPQQGAKPQVLTPGAVCSVMPTPEAPAVNWAGEAVLQVIATVRGGKVVGTDFRVAQGALDGKTKRSLQRSVESALAGYQCQGDAVFQQEFAFRID